MAQLMIYVEVSPKTMGRYCPGDAVAVLPDDHEFSPLELNHPRWRIVQIPGLPVSAMAHLELSDIKGAIRRHVVFPDEVRRVLITQQSPVTLTPRQAFDWFGAIRERSYAD